MTDSNDNERCLCGHLKASHHEELGTRYGCLVTRCDCVLFGTHKKAQGAVNTEPEPNTYLIPRKDVVYTLTDDDWYGWLQITWVEKKRDLY